MAHFADALLCISALFINILILWACSPLNYLFAWHPLLMTVGSTVLLSVAVRSLAATSIVSSNVREDRLKRHWTLLFGSLALLFVGFCVIYVNKVLNGKSHFTTWHGILGLCSVIYFAVQVFAGSVIHWKLFPYNQWISYGNARFYHAMSGSLLTILLTLVIILGFLSHWSQSRLTSMFGSNGHLYFLWVTIGSTCFIPLIMLFQVVKKYFTERLKNSSYSKISH